MARGIFTNGYTIASTTLIIMVLLQSAFVWDPTTGAPAKKNDILAGTEFLSVFINGAMAPRPQRRRPVARKPTSNPFEDNATAESRQDEASIFRISRAPSSRATIDKTLPSEEISRFYPVSQKSLSNRPNSTPLEVKSAKENLTPNSSIHRLQNNTNNNLQKTNQRVIGVSVTSTVEATPYKVRVEHHDSNKVAKVLYSSSTSTSSSTSSHAENYHPAFSGATSTTSTTQFTELPAQLITEAISNIVSESNRSEFSVDEGEPKTSWKNKNTLTTKSTTNNDKYNQEEAIDSTASSSDSEPVEQIYELSKQNLGQKKVNSDSQEQSLKGRKTSRHYDDHTSYIDKKGYNEQSKIYPHQNLPAHVSTKSARVFGEPERVYGEPEKIYSKPAKIYGQPSKVYSEPAKIYSEPEKVYGEPEKVYSEAAKVYSVSSMVYSEPEKVYGLDGQPIEREPVEQNYEVDEAVSVGSNGKAHGPQIYTEPPRTTTEDSTKVSYVEEGRNYRKYRIEERTSDGFIVGEYGVVSHDDGSLRGVRYTADGTINPKLIYDALMKFLAL